MAGAGSERRIHGNDVLQAYLRDIGQYRRLTREEEAALARDPTPQARELLYHSSLYLVPRYLPRFQGAGVPEPDLVQEGNIGLLRAARRYDPERGTTFKTYATPWIIQAFQRAISRQGSAITRPRGLFHISRRAEAEYAQNRKQDWDALARRYGMKPQLLRQRILRFRARAYPIAADGGDGNRQGIPESSLPAPEITPAEIAEQRDRIGAVLRAVERLPRHERTVIERRLLLERPESLEAVGGQLHLSRERIRQLQEQALGRLRNELLAADV